MTIGKVYKLAALNLFIVVINVILLSDGLVGLSVFNPDLKIKLMTAGLYFLDVIIFVFGNYMILNKKPRQTKYDEAKLVTTKDFIQRLEQCRSKQEFRDEAETTIKQISRLQQKIETLNLILSQHFTEGTLTYQKFSNTIYGIQQLYFSNVKKMIGRIVIFNQEEYNHKDDVELDEASKKVRNQIFREHIDYVESMVKKGEDILIKLDNLILEISKLDDTNATDLNDLSTVQEINDLIEQTKYYKSQK